MATFKKFDNQEVYQLITDSAVSANVGDVISYNPSSKEIVVVPSMDAAIEARGAEGKSLYLIAQSDAVTYKNGTSYKTKLLERSNPNYDVYSTGDAEHIVVAYRIENLANIEGLEA